MTSLSAPGGSLRSRRIPCHILARITLAGRVVPLAASEQTVAAPAFCRRRRWLVDDIAADLERRPEPVDRTKAIPLPQLERLWRCEDVAVREKALWRAAL